MTKLNTEATAQADLLDVAGEHDEAINVLARATKLGDLVAMTRLAKRLLVGDRAPYLPKEAAGMVLEAAQKNNAEAVALMAIFQCTGVFQQKNWGHSLSTLIHAAKLGWRASREQLLLLSAEYDFQHDSVLLQNNDPAFWETLGSKIKLDQWFKTEDGAILNNSPLVCCFDDFISEEVCRFLVAKSQVRLSPALVYDPLSRTNIRSRTRTNSIATFNLVENEAVHFLLQERMSAACNIPMTHMEATAILHYSPGEEISGHYDFVDPKLPNYEQEINDNGQRVITFLIYLNEDYQGGETNFSEFNLSHKGKAGQGLYFVNALEDGSSDLRTRHAGSPTSAGEKWIVSQFIRNRPVNYLL